MSVYGYPYQTTPFLNQANGLFIDGMYAMGPNTVSSLSRTLQFKESENNIVTLAQQAGFTTYWLSAQGMLGKHDTSTSAVALRADKTYFLNKGSFSDNDVNDDDLLLPFKHLLSYKKNEEKQLFILHLSGSHPDACKRLHGYPINFDLGYGKGVNCYLASIAKTDYFIQQVVSQLSDREYSLVYFSDHGLSVKPDSIKNDATIKNNYQIPFIVLGSHFSEHKYISHQLSQKNFLDFMATWLGVQTNMTDSQYNFDTIHILPKANKIEVFNWEKMVDVSTLKDEEVLK